MTDAMITVAMPFSTLDLISRVTHEAVNQCGTELIRWTRALNEDPTSTFCMSMVDDMKELLANARAANEAVGYALIDATYQLRPAGDIFAEEVQPASYIPASRVFGEEVQPAYCA